MSSINDWLLIPGPRAILCPDCQQLVGQGAAKHHAKNCFPFTRIQKAHEVYLRCLVALESNSH